MISKELQPTFSFEGHRNYIFIKRCHDGEGGVHYHFFIFDEVGGCSEARYFCHPAYLRQIESSILKTRSGASRVIWELEPSGELGYPLPSYAPLLQQVRVGDKGHLCLDNLYSMETLRNVKFREACDASETPEAGGGPVCDSRVHAGDADTGKVSTDGAGCG